MARWSASRLLWLVVACAVFRCSASSVHGAVSGAAATSGDSPSSTPHSNNWAVIVSTSRYWFNYRHTANALAMYHAVKRMGIPDAQIILMLPDEYACNPRNLFPGRIYHTDAKRDRFNLYADDIEVDYRGTEVSVESFLRLLTGRHTHEGTPRSRRLLTNAESNIFIYMSGHGGNNFLKFQDNEEMNAQDLRDALQQMYAQERYRSILFVLDTCQAATLFWELNPQDTPNVITIGSSRVKENSYSYAHDYELGLSLSDRFSFFTLDFFERNRVIAHHDQHAAAAAGSHSHPSANGDLDSRKTIADLFMSYDPVQLRSHVEYRSDLLLPSIGARTRAHPNPLARLPLTDYFGAVTPIRALRPDEAAYPLEPSNTLTQQPPLRRQRAFRRRQPHGTNGEAAAKRAPSTGPAFHRLGSSTPTVAIVALLLALAAFLLRPTSSTKDDDVDENERARKKRQ